jgi:Tfp pilus assembly protein PilV
MILGSGVPSMPELDFVQPQRRWEMFPEKQTKYKIRGFTLTEAAIVLGIVGLILGSIWVAAAAVYRNMRVSTTSNQLLQITQSIRSMHATSATVDSAITAVALATAGAIPGDMLDNLTAPTTVRDVWTGNVTVTAATQTVAGDSFTIAFAKVPRDACIDILVRNTGAGRDSGLVKAGSLASQTTNMPITVTGAAAYCSTTTVTGNTIAFTFLLKS